MFVGKLEPAKGPLEFADGFLNARRNAPVQLHALVVGSGSLADAVRAKFTAADAVQDLTLIERLPHDQIAGALARADIYVSLNRYGNLSNANLEAMRAGKAMIIPRAQTEIGVDVVTDQLISPRSVLRVESPNDVAGIGAAIVSLTGDPMERQRRAKLVREESDRFASTWRQRIDTEIKLLHQVAQAEKPLLDTKLAGTADRGR
jgi:glycosyltransferase involved in cell wall biosynthesis